MATLEDIQSAGEDFVIPENSADSKLHWITLPPEPGEAPEVSNFKSEPQHIYQLTAPIPTID